jgi:hypothetical protein
MRSELHVSPNPGPMADECSIPFAESEAPSAPESVTLDIERQSTAASSALNEVKEFEPAKNSSTSLEIITNGVELEMETS